MKTSLTSLLLPHTGSIRNSFPKQTCPVCILGSEDGWRGKSTVIKVNEVIQSKHVPHNDQFCYPVGQCVTQSWRRCRYPGEQVRQSLGDAPVQVEQAWSHGKQYPSSVPSASCLVTYVPAGQSLTQLLSGKWHFISIYSCTIFHFLIFFSIYLRIAIVFTFLSWGSKKASVWY